MYAIQYTYTIVILSVLRLIHTMVVNIHMYVTCTVYVNKTSLYSTVVSLSHYSSSTVVLTVIGVLVNVN